MIDAVRVNKFIADHHEVFDGLDQAQLNLYIQVLTAVLDLIAEAEVTPSVEAVALRTLEVMREEARGWGYDDTHPLYETAATDERFINGVGYVLLKLAGGLLFAQSSS